MSERPAITGERFAPDRRDALRLLAAGAAAALSSCGPPREEIVPYVKMPEGLTPGVPLQFATALSLSGYARGVIVTSHEGRPTRIEGNPRHPASLGACDVFAQAEIMSLYDPDRAKIVTNQEGPSSWAAFEKELLSRAEIEKRRGGAKLSILSGRITSPTLGRQLQSLLEIFPQARWRRFEPIHDDNEISGATMAFGRPLIALPRLERATVVVSLEADPLGAGPSQLLHAHAFAERRQARLPLERFLRLYAAESSLTLTGANSDERLTLAPSLIHGLAVEIANYFGAGYASAGLSDEARRFLSTVVGDLNANSGGAIILAGRTLPPEVHALCHWINQRLRAPVDYFAPVDPVASGHVASLQGLAHDLESGRVESLFIIGCNPAYAAPGEFEISRAIAKAPFSVHLGLYDDETAALCKWRLPLSHSLECWSDLRAVEGTASIVQPLIRPLYDTRTPEELVASLVGMRSATSYQLVQQNWRAHAPDDFDASWRRWLHDGVIPDSANSPVVTPIAVKPAIEPVKGAAGLCLTLAPDPSVWDGSFSNNAWLQECPKPTTKEVWGNALYLSREDAAAQRLQEGDVVTLSTGAFSLAAPVSISASQAKGVVAATLGYGRTRAGAIGNKVGFNANLLASAATPFLAVDVSLSPTNERREILRTQRSFGLERGRDDVFPTFTLQNLIEGAACVSDGHNVASLLPDWSYESYKWAMSIDNTLCIGCNACLIACQAENNVPVVGPVEVSMGREMHWLRVDVYNDGGAKPLGFQPVPCMHCEKAPCEPVCPVEASVHDSEGLNVQVYNRCIGTRFCQSNCPYKVRRFNFFGYATTDEAYANLGAQSMDAIFNPDVTVRSRGVMEKCTYCVQRISRARRAAEREERRIGDGEVVTACQSACPTRAIRFGDLNDAGSKVREWRKEPQHYAMLGHLDTRPRTTYLARVGNPHPGFADGER